MITFVLAIPFIGVRLDYADGKNILVLHPLDLAGAVLAVFAGRLAFELWSARPSTRHIAHASLPRLPRIGIRIVGGCLIAVAVVFPLTPFVTRYQLDLASTFFTYVMLGWGLNVVVGLAGLLDLGYVAFYAVGAYAFGILATRFGVGFWTALPLSGLFAGAFGVLLGFPVLRLKGDYLAVVTLGFGEIIRIVIINWINLTGGPNGISGIPRPSFFGHPFAVRASHGTSTFAQLFGIRFSPLQRITWLYYVILALALATLLLTQRLRRLPIGRAWEALREDEVACQAIGLNPTIIKLTAFAIGAMIGGLAGCFFATRQGFISPESFTFSESAVILAIVVLGGMGSQLGIAVAAAVLVGLPEIGRGLADYRMLLFGLAMVLIMIWRPRGLITSRSPSVRVDLGAFPAQRVEAAP